jgi:hypothetical protein
MICHNFYYNLKIAFSASFKSCQLIEKIIGSQSRDGNTYHCIQEMFAESCQLLAVAYLGGTFQQLPPLERDKSFFSVWVPNPNFDNF